VLHPFDLGGEAVQHGGLGRAGRRGEFEGEQSRDGRESDYDVGGIGLAPQRPVECRFRLAVGVRPGADDPQPCLDGSGTARL